MLLDLLPLLTPERQGARGVQSLGPGVMLGRTSARLSIRTAHLGRVRGVPVRLHLSLSAASTSGVVAGTTEHSVPLAAAVVRPVVRRASGTRLEVTTHSLPVEELVALLVALGGAP